MNDEFFYVEKSGDREYYVKVGFGDGPRVGPFHTRKLSEQVRSALAYAYRIGTEEKVIYLRRH